MFWYVDAADYLDKMTTSFEFFKELLKPENFPKGALCKFPIQQVYGKHFPFPIFRCPYWQCALFIMLKERVMYLSDFVKKVNYLILLV